MDPDEDVDDDDSEDPEAKEYARTEAYIQKLTPVIAKLPSRFDNYKIEMMIDNSDKIDELLEGMV